MSRLASFVTALWLSFAAANPASISDIVNNATNQLTNEVQAGLDPVGKTLGFIGGGLCKGVKPIAGVAYENVGKEPDMSKLTLVLQTSAKTVTYNLAKAPEEIAKDSWINLKIPFTVFIHGFTDNPSKDNFQDMNRAFAEKVSKGEMNFMALDASSLIYFFYIRSTFMTAFIGEKLGKFLAALESLLPDYVHLIGHSLGAHIAGFTGQTYYNLTGSLIRQITALDPAGPCFSDLKSTMRLSKDDAEYVKVIHTDKGVFGLDEQIGHADFYPNGGEKQTGCLLSTCGHGRAVDYYTQSVPHPELFIAVKCNSYYDFRHGLCDYNDTSLMGYGTPFNTTGMYYCQTLGKEPFGAGEEGLTYKKTSMVGSVFDDFKDAFSG